ncbi:hypothetical protein V8C44DRAFT_265326 [Trichoderma aethiopicum]
MPQAMDIHGQIATDLPVSRDGVLLVSWRVHARPSRVAARAAAFVRIAGFRNVTESDEHQCLVSHRHGRLHRSRRKRQGQNKRDSQSVSQSQREPASGWMVPTRGRGTPSPTLWWHSRNGQTRAWCARLGKRRERRQQKKDSELGTLPPQVPRLPLPSSTAPYELVLSSGGTGEGTGAGKRCKVGDAVMKRTGTTKCSSGFAVAERVGLRLPCFSSSMRLCQSIRGKGSEKQR